MSTCKTEPLFLYSPIKSETYSYRYSPWETVSCTFICFSVDAQLYLNIYYRYLYMTGFFCIFVYATPLIMLVFLNVKVILELRRARKNWGTINRNEQKELRASLMPLVSLNYSLQLIIIFLLSQGNFAQIYQSSDLTHIT